MTGGTIHDMATGCHTAGSATLKLSLSRVEDRIIRRVYGLSVVTQRVTSFISVRIIWNGSLRSHDFHAGLLVLLSETCHKDCISSNALAVILCYS